MNLKTCTFLLSVIFIFSTAYSQDYPELVEFESGKAILGGGYQYQIKDWRMHYIGSDQFYQKINRESTAIGEIPSSNNPDRFAHLSAFLMGKKEITNEQYRYFLAHKYLGEDKAKKLFKEIRRLDEAKEIRKIWQPVYEKAMADHLWPDTACWTRDFVFAHNEPLSVNYHYHPAFDEYPVVGVTWRQASAYCEWLTKAVNADLVAKGKEPLPPFRLPTEAEWEYAAKASQTKEEFARTIYPWNGLELVGHDGKYKANIKTGSGNYIGDNYEYTAPADQFFEDDNGLYQMAGNAAEWTSDDFQVVKLSHPGFGANNSGIKVEQVPEMEGFKVVKGGSWADYKYASMCGSRTGFDPEKGHSRVGFRVARSAK